MKKLLALLLALLMLLSLAACGEKEEIEIEDPGVPVKEDVVDEPVVEEPETELTIHENTYFTVAYDEAAGWSIAEDDVYTYETGGNVYVRILDEEGNTDIVVTINADEDDPEDFRKALYVNGFDAKAYAEGSVETVDVGGQSMLYVDQDNGDRFYFGRNEQAGVYYTIDATNWEDPRVPALIEGITCTAEGTDNVEAPWPWEGEAFSAASAEQMVGTYTLKAEFLPMSEALTTFETFKHDVEVIGDKVYLLSDYVLREYTCDGTALTFSREIPLDAEYEMVESAGDDLVLSSFMKPTIGHDGDTVLYSYDGPDKFSVAPDGTWGISWFSSGETTEKFTFSDGALVAEPMPFAEVKLISKLCIDDSYIYVTGSPVEGSGHYVFVYDHSGSLKMQLTGDPTATIGLGSVTYVTKTANGFIALDGNMRDIVLWTADGTWLGAVDADDLLGTDYPWLASADVMADGSILCVLSQDRADGSAMEAVAFKLSGF
ncbi:MAG: hypothetical protein J6J43_06370 [Oscillospiraceae bacterium]|nr:hypothetical protein [Oscillospiraceae bacterium]